MYPILPRLGIFSILLLCQSCDGSIGFKNRPLEEKQAIQYFYGRHPFLVNKIQDLSVYVYKSPYRETTAYYRFIIDEASSIDLISHEKYGIYVDTRNLSDKEKNQSMHSNGYPVKFECDMDFIKLQSQDKSLLPWWDLDSLKDKTCYIQRPLNGSRQRRAIFDRKSRIVYMYSYVAW